MVALESDVEHAPLLPSKAAIRRVTPLPAVQIATLFVLQLPEPITASVIYPFIAQLINELGITGGDARRVGYYAGLIESLFFLTECCFILQWGRLSDQGRRPVLLCGLFGLALSICSFGLATNFAGLVLSRALAGALCGNIGVVKSVIGEITDESNMATAFGTLPISWALGTTIGPVLGGYLSHPADTWPEIFHPDGFWSHYPYSLPCFATALITVFAFGVTYAFLEETAPACRPSATKEWEIFPEEPPPANYETFSPPPKVPLPPSPPAESSITSLLTRPVRISIFIYGLLALVDISTFALLPLILACPISAGGLGFSPKTIGTCLGVYGIVNGLVQFFISPIIQRRLGLKLTFTISSALFIPLILGFPLANYIAMGAGEHITAGVWLILCSQFIICTIVNISFSCIFILITTAVTDRSKLGATNGLAQTTASFMRFLGPAGATSLFAWSTERGGYLIYAVLVTIAVSLCAATRLIPDEGWVREQSDGRDSNFS